MDKRLRKAAAAHEPRLSLGELIHQHVRLAIETAVHEELRVALRTSPYERRDIRRGYRNGTKARTLTGPTGPVALMLPGATLFGAAGGKERKSAILPRYQRRMPEVNEAVVATYLAGGNTRRIRGALKPLLKAAPLSKSAVSRVVATLKDGLEAWRTRSLADLDVIYVYLDGFALRVRSAGKVVSVPVLGVIGVLPDGHKHLLALDLCGESLAAWKGCLDDLVARGFRRSSGQAAQPTKSSWRSISRPPSLGAGHSAIGAAAGGPSDRMISRPEAAPCVSPSVFWSDWPRRS